IPGPRRRMGDRGYQKRRAKPRILIRFLRRPDARPHGADHIPESVGDGSVLRRAGMQAVRGEPVATTVRLAGHRSDVREMETTSIGLVVGDAIEGIDAGAKVTGGAKGGGAG